MGKGGCLRDSRTELWHEFVGFSSSAFCAAFDENDRLIKRTFIKAEGSNELKDAILKWLESPLPAVEKRPKN